MYGFWRVLCLRKYFAEFSYLPQEKSNEYDKDLPDLSTSLPECFTRVNDVFLYFLSCHQKFIGETVQCAPKARFNDGFTDIMVRL